MSWFAQSVCNEARLCSNEKIDGDEHGAVKPICVAMLQDLRNQEDAEHLADRVELTECKIHRLVIHPPKHNCTRDDKECDLS
mmetsp:Transcript_68319/g.129015  ORF Transcript_68319/g.129015 Transcript_68319/m.129015 type:complete len:82 (+) Transcript_68319:68-313(+)